MLASWDAMGRIALQGVLSYAALIVFLRLTGNRTLSKMNSFDLIVTIALGSLLATTIMDQQVSVLEGLTALGLLVALQYAVTWLSVRSQRLSRLFKTRPTLVYDRAGYRYAAMRRIRVVAEEVRSAVRQQGLGGLEQVAAVVLESDGKLTVIPAEQLGSGSALVDVRGLEAETSGPKETRAGFVD